VEAQGLRVANGPHQEALQVAELQKEEAQLQAQSDAHANCIKKSNAYIAQQCPNLDPQSLDYWSCSQRIEKTAYFKQNFPCDPGSLFPTLQ
jgi:hypothetical protein